MLAKKTARLWIVVSIMPLVCADLSFAQTLVPTDRYLVRDPATLTVPRQLVMRKDYVEFIRHRAKDIESVQDHGKYGARRALPALAVFAIEEDPVKAARLAADIKKTLRYFTDWAKSEVSTTGGVHPLDGVHLVPHYFRELRRRGYLTPEDEIWARSLILMFREYGYAWSPKDGLWRGSHHRAQAQGVAHALAASYYSSEPGAPDWAQYAETVWDDWWSFRDIAMNDAGYFLSSMLLIMSCADLLDREEVFTDVQMLPFFERLMEEVTPDGVVIPYGSSGGYNSYPGRRIYALELASRYTRDGRYRWVAHRLMNHLQARTLSGYQFPLEYDIEELALASLCCDDSVAPQQPQSGSRLSWRKETIGLSDAKFQEMFPGAGRLDCGWYMTQRSMPNKLIMRSGWNPGDLYMLVDCYVRHAPLNPTAILGLERHSASFAEMHSEKNSSRENAVFIEDVSNTVTFLGRKGFSGEKVVPWGWLGMSADVPVLADHALATHAQISVGKYMGYAIDQKREFLFIKNRFVLVRDETIFREAFRARLGPVWNTQHIGDVSGSNWINTWFTDHYFGAKRYDVPPWDLMVYYGAKPGARFTEKEISDVSQKSLRSTWYQWEGDVTPGQRLQFVQVLLPHAPLKNATGLAKGITVLRDEPGVAAVSVSQNSVLEFALVNSGGQYLEVPLSGGRVSTDARACYLKFAHGVLESFLVEDSKLLQLNGVTLHQSAVPVTREISGSETSAMMTAAKIDDVALLGTKK